MVTLYYQRLSINVKYSTYFKNNNAGKLIDSDYGITIDGQLVDSDTLTIYSTSTTSSDIDKCNIEILYNVL